MRPLPGTLGVLALVATAAVTSPAAAPAAPAAQPPVASAAPSGCDRTVDQDGGTSAKHDLDSGGRTRGYVLHLPQGYERRDDWPLVVAFHGRGSTGAEVEGYSGLSRLPAVVAYPDGTPDPDDDEFRRAWQGAPYEVAGVDDVVFTVDLLDELQATLCVDPDRAYATGKSNGAGLVGLLACRLPDRLAAVAPVAGAFYPGTTEGCEGASPVPVLEVHGTGDATIPYDGDADRGLPAVPDWVAGWVARDDCRREPRVVRTGRDVVTTTWRGCADGTEVQHVAVRGGGHVWPGSDVYSGGGRTTQTIEAHRVVWRFLSRHSLAERGTSQGEAR
jgi:polyhydroxybutyrate depolymerase